jgi:hypothetical protein
MKTQGLKIDVLLLKYKQVSITIWTLPSTVLAVIQWHALHAVSIEQAGFQDEQDLSQ